MKTLTTQKSIVCLELKCVWVTILKTLFVSNNKGKRSPFLTKKMKRFSLGIYSFLTHEHFVSLGNSFLFLKDPKMKSTTSITSSLLTFSSLLEFLFECLTRCSSRVSAASECDVELNTRREIPYLQATIYYFVYHINTIALYWEEKPTSLMNENKWIDNPRITIVECVGADS